MDAHSPNVELLETGVRLGRTGRAASFVAYRDLLHVVGIGRGLRLATARGVLAVPRSAGEPPAAPIAAGQALRERVLALPDGSERIRRMEDLDLLMLRAGPPRLSQAIAALCVTAFALQLWIPGFTEQGALRPGWLAVEPWGAVTAHFLHGAFAGFPALLSPHLILNVLCLLGLGAFVERMLGQARTAVVLLAAGGGAALASLVADYVRVVGASGLVMGLAGALVVLEFGRPERIPAPWRLPRRLLIGLLGADLLLTGFIPDVAHAAHWGGLTAGGLAAWLATSDPVPLAPPPRWVVAGAGLGLFSVVVAGAGLGWAVLDPGAASLRRAAYLADDPDASPGLLNDAAWTIAISDAPDAELLAAAEEMAERAVDATSRSNPNLLDTLAEIAFIRGRPEDAVALIDEAIALAPEEPYYREQRRRFTGERAADDRPADPSLPPPRQRHPPPSREPLPEDGLRV